MQQLSNDTYRTVSLCSHLTSGTGSEVRDVGCYVISCSGVQNKTFLSPISSPSD